MPMEAIKIPRTRCLPLLLLLVVASCLSLLLEFSEAGKRVSVPDELDDVVDDEEDEEWKRWGQKKRTTTDLPPPPDFSRMSPLEIQSEMMKRHTGPTLGFIKLRPGVPRSRVTPNAAQDLIIFCVLLFVPTSLAYCCSFSCSLVKKRYRANYF